MTTHEVLISPARQPLLTVCLLLLVLQMILFFASYQDERSRRCKLLYFLQLMIGFIALYLPLLDISWDINYPDGSRAPYTLLSLFRSLPVSVMIGYEILAAALLAAGFWNLFYYRKNHLTSQSIKETMDLLPAGIAFGKPDGTVVFSNLAMNHLSRAVNGRGITNLSDFKEAAPGQLITLQDGFATWQLSSEALEVEDEPYIQLTATDITQEAVITKELEKKNKKLRDMHMRLYIYNKQADHIIIAQELLTARMTVHNEVGNVLLESRHYLNDPESFDEEMLLKALQNTNTYLLKEYEEDDTQRDPLNDALEMAEAIGVDVAITGVIPPNDPYRKVLAAAIIECGTNTVKHANGDRLAVDIQSTDKEIIYTLESNGERPKGAIHESGGLLTLRTLVENENGIMRIEAAQHFCLEIRMRK